MIVLYKFDDFSVQLKNFRSRNFHFLKSTQNRFLTITWSLLRKHQTFSIANSGQVSLNLTILIWSAVKIYFLSSKTSIKKFLKHFLKVNTSHLNAILTQIITYNKRWGSHEDDLFNESFVCVKINFIQKKLYHAPTIINETYLATLELLRRKRITSFDSKKFLKK